VDQDGGSDLVDIVAVSQDGSETANATGVVSVTDWTPIRSDKHRHLLRVQVRPIQHCSSWNFSRLSFDIKMARRFRIRVGEVYITDWVSSNVIHGLQDQARSQTFASGFASPSLLSPFFLPPSLLSFSFPFCFVSLPSLPRPPVPAILTSAVGYGAKRFCALGARKSHLTISLFLCKAYDECLPFRR